jgi:phage repressor protein C with HTH and peptisase S24 domain
MAPAIQNGDLVIIDTTRRDLPLRKPTKKPHQLPIFAFIQDEQARVKRLERFPKEKLIILYSDNNDIAPEIIGESNVNSINILGQVVWSGHVWR